jgi:fumarate hydratase subunit alpha
MREVSVTDIRDIVSRLCKEANFYLGEDVVAALRKARDNEESPVARQVLDQILENAEVAAKEEMPLCQDCGRQERLCRWLSAQVSSETALFSES